jgi:hypothetical protein
MGTEENVGCVRVIMDKKNNILNNKFFSIKKNLLYVGQVKSILDFLYSFIILLFK